MALGFSWGTTKPPSGVTLNLSHPLCSGLVCCLAMREGAGSFRDELGGVLNPVSNGMTWMSSAQGPGLNTVQASSQYSTYDNKRLWDIPYPVTFAWGFVPTTVGINQGIWQTDSNGTTYSGFMALINSGNNIELTAGDNTGSAAGNRRTGVSSGGLVSAGKVHNIVQIARGGADMSCYVNGNSSAMTYSGTGSLTQTFGAHTNGELGRRVAGSTIYANGMLLYLMVWSRDVGDAAARELSIAPYQMFAPPVWRRYFVPAAVAAGGSRYLLERPEGLVRGGLVHA